MKTYCKLFYLNFYDFEKEHYYMLIKFHHCRINHFVNIYFTLEEKKPWINIKENQSWINNFHITHSERKLTGHNWQNFSSHATAMKFIGYKKLVLWITNIHENYDCCDYVKFAGNFLKNRYFANNFLIKVWIWELFFTHDTHMIVIILRIPKFRFALIDFWLNTIFPQFCVF